MGHEADCLWTGEKWRRESEFVGEKQTRGRKAYHRRGGKTEGDECDVMTEGADEFDESTEAGELNGTEVVEVT